MLAFYGTAQSRASRCLWALEEIGVPFTHVPINANAGEAGTPEFLKINPAGKVPALVDGDLKLAESMAINIHLARKYSKELWVKNADDESRVLQWSLWVMTDFEPHVLTIGRQEMLTSPEERRMDRVHEAREELAKTLPALDLQLSRSEWILGGSSFSVADLNVASVLALTLMIPFDISAYSHLTRWTKACFERPAFRRVFTPA
jgi:glutathione S-transferase